MAEKTRTATNRRRSGQPVGEPRPGAPAPAQASASSELNALIHERTRLGIVGALAARDRLSFAELRGILKTTDGNISAHTRKLEDAGYIVSHKRFEGRVPRTEYELTEAGRQALERYLEQMEALIQTMRGR